MSEGGKNLLYRQNIVKNHFEESPIHYEKRHPLPSHSVNRSLEDIDKIINISMSGVKKGGSSPSHFRIPNRPCQTTINLFINDPHMMENDWENNTKLPARRNLKNEIVLGKNIPDHTLMKNLLGDLGVKKYSSAPNMTNKCVNNRKSLSGDKYYSGRTLTKSFEGFRTNGYAGNAYSPVKETRFLYGTEGRNGGDFKPNSIGKINEEDEVQEHTVHYLDHCVVKSIRDPELTEEENPQINLREPLKKFTRKPFSIPQVSKNPAIPCSDIVGDPGDKLEQPRRKNPSFLVRTQMVREILSTNHELVNSYQSGLMRNHKGLFETLRQKDFRDITNDNVPVEKIESVPSVEKDGKIDRINKRQCNLVLSGKNKLPICSVESHGSYEEYKRNLVRAPDGTLCCKNLEYSDDDLWSRAATRNIITSEFVKDKIQKFDELFRKKSGNSNGPLEALVKNKLRSVKQNYMKTKYDITNYSHLGKLSCNFLNEEDITFPKETKHAMTGLMSKNSRVFLERQNSNSNGKILATFREKGYVLATKSVIAGSSSSREDSMQSGWWPGVAERVQSTAEGSTT